MGFGCCDVLGSSVLDISGRYELWQRRTHTGSRPTPFDIAGSQCRRARIKCGRSVTTTTTTTAAAAFCLATAAVASTAAVYTDTGHFDIAARAAAAPPVLNRSI